MANVVKKVTDYVKEIPGATKELIGEFKKTPGEVSALVVKTLILSPADILQWGIGKIADSKLMPGKKSATALSMSNTLVGLPGAPIGMGIDAIGALADAIYHGKPVKQLIPLAVSAGLATGKNSVDDVVDKAVACCKAHDPDFSKQDLVEFGGYIKQGGKNAWSKLVDRAKK